MGRLCIVLKKLAEYAHGYNYEMYRQLLVFIEVIQNKSLKYSSWVFLRRWVKLVIEGLGDGQYDLANIPEEIMLALLAKDIGTKNTIAVATINKLETGPYAKDVKEASACYFYNRLKCSDKGCQKDEKDCSRKHVCACCGKPGHIFWECNKRSASWKKSDKPKIKLLVTHEIKSIRLCTMHNEYIQHQNENRDIDFSACIENNYYNPPGVIDDALVSYKVGNFRADNFEWRNLEFPATSTTRKTLNMCKKFCIRVSGFKIVAWQKYLKKHPNKAYSTWIVKSILQGAPLGYTGPRNTIIVKNDGLEQESREAIETRVKEEADLGRSYIFGRNWPKNEWPFDEIRSNGTFTIPKPVGFRAIDDLSRPEGQAVNDGIKKEDFPVRFSTFLDAIKIIRENKGRIWMWQRDLKDAYRQILINPMIGSYSV